MKLLLKESWDFEDYKGWEIMLGVRQEGQITWRNADNDMVKEGNAEVGFEWTGYVPNHDLRGGPFDSLEACLADFAKAVFGEVIA